LLTDDARQTFLKQISNPSLDYLRRKQLHKKIWEKARKLKKCAHCGAHNGKLYISMIHKSNCLFLGVVKKAVGSVLKIVHAYKEDDTVSYSTAIDENKELGTAIGKADVELLTPTDVYALLENVQKAVS
jgi:DNA-directed RNA polymerase III subunit RPC1